MRTTHVNKSLPGELGEDIVVKYYKRGSPEAAMPIMTPNLLILSYLIFTTENGRNVLYHTIKAAVRVRKGSC